MHAEVAGRLPGSGVTRSPEGNSDLSVLLLSAVSFLRPLVATAAGAMGLGRVVLAWAQCGSAWLSVAQQSVFSGSLLLLGEISTLLVGLHLPVLWKQNLLSGVLPYCPSSV